MKVLFLSEIEDLQVLDIKDVLDSFIESGAEPDHLKYIIEALEKQGFDIGQINGIGFAIINLDLPEFTIHILPKEKIAYEGIKNGTHF